jgi:hypothetical protein
MLKGFGIDFITCPYSSAVPFPSLPVHKSFKTWMSHNVQRHKTFSAHYQIVTKRFVNVYVLWRCTLCDVYVLKILRFGTLTLRALRHVKFMLCCFTLCSNIPSIDKQRQRLIIFNICYRLQFRLSLYFSLAVSTFSHQFWSREGFFCQITWLGKASDC